MIITLLNNDNNELYLSVKSSRSGALRSDTSRGLVALSVKTSTKAGRSDQALIRCTRSDFRWGGGGGGGKECDQVFSRQDGGSSAGYRGSVGRELTLSHWLIYILSERRITEV